MVTKLIILDLIANGGLYYFRLPKIIKIEATSKESLKKIHGTQLIFVFFETLGTK